MGPYNQTLVQRAGNHIRHGRSYKKLYRRKEIWDMKRKLLKDTNLINYEEVNSKLK